MPDLEGMGAGIAILVVRQRGHRVVRYVGNLSRSNVAALPDGRALAVAQHRLPDAPPIVPQIPARLGHSELHHSSAVQSAPGKDLHGIEIFSRFEQELDMEEKELKVSGQCFVAPLPA